MDVHAKKQVDTDSVTVVSESQKGHVTTTTTEATNVAVLRRESSQVSGSNNSPRNSNVAEDENPMKSDGSSDGSTGISPSVWNRFNWETKFVVLNFMRNLPKDVDRRVWTPLSSTPSSLASDTNDFTKKLRTARKHKLRHETSNSPISEEERDLKHRRQTPESEKVAGAPHGDNETQGDLIRCSADGNSTHRDTNITPPIYQRTTSSSSSRGDSSITTDADDELGSSSSHSSHRVDSVESGRFLIETENVVTDGPSDDEQYEGVEEIDLLSISQSGRQREKQLSSTQTIVPTSDGLDHVDSPNSLEDSTEDELVFNSNPKPEKSALRLDLDVCFDFNQPPNISESLTAVLAESTSELQSEVQDAVLQGELTRTDQTRALSLASPETEVALVLRKIADRVEVQYGEQLQAAVENVFRINVNTIPYEIFRSALLNNMDSSVNDLNQMVLCLVYSQRLTFALLQSGERKVHYLLDYAARLLAERAANFIIKHGGWDSLGEADIDTFNELSSSHGSASSRVSSPSKLDRIQELNNNREPLTEEVVVGDVTSQSDSSNSDKATRRQLGFGSYFSPGAMFQRAHHLGFRVSVVVAVAVVGVAVVLSKHQT